MHPDNKDTLLATNIPANVICWNAIGCIFSAFLFFFDGVLRTSLLPHTQSADSSSLSSSSTGVNLMGYSNLSPSFVITILVLVGLCTTWTIFMPFTFVTPIYAVYIMLAPLGYAVYATYLIIWEKHDSDHLNSYPARYVTDE